MKKLKLVAFLVLLNLMVINTSKATTIYVGTIAELQTKINAASTLKGDIFLLANGTYLNSTLYIVKNDITIKAATPGGVLLNGNNNITILSNGVTFSGFQFRENTTMSGSPITVSGNSNTLTQLNFNGYSADHMIYITGTNNTISYSNFENKPAIMTPKAGTGDLIQIIPNEKKPGYNKIQYCSFQHLPGLGGDYGNECIRIGNSNYATVISRTIVEYCYFEDTGLGDSETISVKSMENILRFNTMRNNQKANFCFRNGNNNCAYGNFFINSGGIRLKEANNIYCYNNYFENCGDGSLSAPIKYVYDHSSIVDHLNNLNFVHNTFVGGTPIQLGKPTTPNNGNIPVTTFTNNTWANNIFINKTEKIFSEKVKGNSFVGNIYDGNLGVNIASGMNNINPNLVINEEGYYGLTSNSPAIDAASSIDPAILHISNTDDDPNLLFDISGQARPTTLSLKDVGCGEFTTGDTTNHPLTLSEVGPSYLAVLATTRFDLKNTNTSIFPNPAKNNLTIQFPITIDSDIELTISTINGQLLKKQIISQNEIVGFKKQIELTDFKNGIYLLQLHSNNYLKTSKIVIQK